MPKGFENFLKVLLYSLTSPLKLTTLGLSILFAATFPGLAVIIIPLGLVSVGLMIASELASDDYIKKALVNKSNSKTLDFDRQLQLLISQVKEQLRQPNQSQEVTKDLQAAIFNLSLIQETSKNLGQVEIGQTQVLNQSLPKVIDKLLKLSNQEQVARNYLNQHNPSSIQGEIHILKQELDNCQDEIGRNEYKKAIKLKIDQLQLVQQMQTRLQRIDSYLARIKAVLEQTNAYLTKVSLRDEQQIIDEGELLTENLQQITLELEDLPDLAKNLA